MIGQHAQALRPIRRHEFVNLIIPANTTATRFNFPDVQNLRQTCLRGLTVYTSLNFTQNLEQVPLLKADDMLNCFITLQMYNGQEFLHQAPAQNFFQLFTESAGDPSSRTNFNFRDFTDQAINWPKSYIEFVTSPGVVNEQVFCCSVWYSYPQSKEQKAKEASFENRS